MFARKSTASCSNFRRLRASCNFGGEGGGMNRLPKIHRHNRNRLWKNFL